MKTTQPNHGWKSSLGAARQRRCCTGDDGLARQVVERAAVQGVTLDLRRVRDAIEDSGAGELSVEDGLDDPWAAVDDALDARED